jgi:hypothetical protein
MTRQERNVVPEGLICDRVRQLERCARMQDARICALERAAKEQCVDHVTRSDVALHRIIELRQTLANAKSRRVSGDP